MRNSVQTFTQFNQFKTELLEERLEEAEAMIFLLQGYTAGSEDRTLYHGLNLLHDSLMQVLQAVRLKPNFASETGGKNV